MSSRDSRDDCFASPLRARSSRFARRLQWNHSAHTTKGDRMYIGGGVLALIIIILLLVWLF
jgi:type II secretory pathway component PulM